MHVGGTCLINGNEVIINYKYIPTKLAYLLTGREVKDESLSRRFYMYEDCLKIAKNNLLIGNGGNAWKLLSQTVQEFLYETKETHSYFLELLISYGVLGTVTFVILVVYLAIKIVKRCMESKQTKKEKVYIFVGLFILVLHNLLFDFGMSFMLIQIVVYICIAMLIYDEQSDIKLPQYIDYIILIFLTFILTIFMQASIAKFLPSDTDKHNMCSYKKTYYYNALKENNADNYIARLNDIKEFIEKEPFSMQTEVYEMYFDEIYKNIDNLSIELFNEYVDFGINKLNTVNLKMPLYVQAIINRTKMLVYEISKFRVYLNKEENVNSEKLQLVNSLVDKLKEVVAKEYNVHMQNIEAKDKNGNSEAKTESFKEQYLNLVRTFI